MSKITGHGRIRPLGNPDGTFALICANRDCLLSVQPFDRSPDGTLSWRHVAKGRRPFTGESRWIVPKGQGYVDSGVDPITIIVDLSLIASIS